MDKVVDKKVNDVVSFTFNSPLKHKTGIPSEKEELSSEIKTPCQKTLPLTGDALGAFLEQKLKELTSHEDDELAAGAPPKKSTAMILQELISALSAEHLTCHDDHIVNADIGFQVCLVIFSVWILVSSPTISNIFVLVSLFISMFSFYQVPSF